MLYVGLSYASLGVYGDPSVSCKLRNSCKVASVVEWYMTNNVRTNSLNGLLEKHFGN